MDLNYRLSIYGTITSFGRCHTVAVLLKSTKTGSDLLYNFHSYFLI